MAREDAIWATGAMSGTSLDGVDWATILTDGIEVFELGASGYRPYSSEERYILRAALGTWPDPSSNIQAHAHEVVINAHIEALRGVKCDIIGFHGQTLNHDAAAGRTFQLGQGEAISKSLGRAVVWDFRSNDVAAGGQGAPLAPFYHHALARRAELVGPVGFLNLGGVGNITIVRDPYTVPDGPGNLLAFDTGPANAPINDLMERHFNKPFDEGGNVAETGKIDWSIVAEFVKDPYFEKLPPKSLDRDSFANTIDKLQVSKPEDAISTAVHLCGKAIAEAFQHFSDHPNTIYLCGGGRKNPSLVGAIIGSVMQVSKVQFVPVEKLGIDGDMLEAQAFAFLAVRRLKGMTLSAPGTTGVPKPITGGRIARP